METKKILLQQFNACHQENTWFVSLQSAVKGISAEQASWKNNESANSIWEIVNHLAYYNQRGLNQFKGNPDEMPAADNNHTFNNKVALNWPDTVHSIDKLMSEWITRIEESNEEYLEKWVSELTHLALHHTYHVGQIVQIRKSMGIWDSAQGVSG
ncbi:DinB family protein [Sediminibacillus albus]|uniref:DinB superfamily protein n=1 Tax=Sediminibacillus albus TaxID=407036 RepID=A0A1G8VIG6_9BACI|nr:DinB family protein [Sediminibacillus albus]SDJ65697.1 DinB superfamily protein [Sediminibacillus albus]